MRKGNIATGTIVPVFENLCLPWPNGEVRIGMSRQPYPNPEELEGEKPIEEYFAPFRTHEYSM